MKNVMVPEELFGKLLKYHLLDQKQEEDDIKKRIGKKAGYNDKSRIIQQVQNSSNRGRKRKVPAGISGKKGNTGKLSMVKLLVDYSITGACHAPVNIRQGKVCKVQTRGYRLPDYL